MIDSPGEADSWMLSMRGRLPESFNTYTAGVFAASAGRGWIPLICGVSYGGKLIGLLFGKEKTVAGCRTGLIYVDSVLGNAVAAETVHQESVLQAALSHVLALPQVRGIRISIVPNGFEHRVLARLGSTIPLDVSGAAIENHAVLPLSASYPEFLQKLGSRTRRNIRNFRRRFEAGKHLFVEDISVADFEKAGEAFLRKDVVGANRAGLKRAVTTLAAVERPILVGLRSRDGVWLAIIGGWYTGSTPVIFIQMNDDRDFADSSLSLVLRSFLIEKLIAEGAEGLLFWGGVGGPIGKYVRRIPTLAAYLDKPTWGWRMFRRGVAALRPHLPERFCKAAEWIVAGGAGEPRLATVTHAIRRDQSELQDRSPAT